MSYHVDFLDSAAKEFRALDKPIQQQITKKLDDLAASDAPRESGSVERVSAADEIWRLRVGKYRVIFEIRDDELLILVLGVGKRDKVYKQALENILGRTRPARKIRPRRK